jgi:isopentenyl diphosphate isomerase/L-lactate dehydrogenase-like FMN-dependent dehydrogenase
LPGLPGLQWYRLRRRSPWSGIRSGIDVLKMLALGADAVLIGRPFSIATMGGLAEGVTTYIGQLKNELQSAMVLTGCTDAADVQTDILRPPAA